jgi:hypothetical protein
MRPYAWAEKARALICRGSGGGVGPRVAVELQSACSRMTVGETAEIRMAKRKHRARNVRRVAARQAKAASEAMPEDQISYSALSLHALFEQQTRQLLDRADLDEEQKQNILVAMSCPCCGAGAMSFTAKLKR